MNTPADGVPPPLLEHVHLVSNYRYPIYPNLSPDDVVQKLVEAASIVKDHAPMTWIYLDSPADGSLHLVWQPPQLGVHFASDGFVWVDPEVAYPLTSGIFNGEVLVQRCGFSAGRENMASHSRRRYHLTSSSDPSISVDPTLWLIHYVPCDPAQRIPAANVQPTPQIQQVLNMRRYLQSQGQLVRKEFMLHDRSNWPTLNLPGAGPPGSRMGGVRPGMPPGPPRAGAGFYGPQHAGMNVRPSPAKRQRQTASGSGPGAGPPPGPAAVIAGRDAAIDEDEDAYPGDLLDNLTPREISVMRYKQHHEWMEEILSSPYNINQLVPVDLGLGRKGELKTLTDGYLEPPAEVLSDDMTVGTFKSRSGNLAQTKLESFKEKSREMELAAEADLQKLRTRHAARLEKLQRGAAFKAAELDLRDATNDSSHSGPEFWRTEAAGARKGQQESLGTTVKPVSRATDDIVAEREGTLQKSIEVSRTVREVQRGGYESPPVIETPPAVQQQNAGADDIMLTDFSTADHSMQLDGAMDGNNEQSVDTSGGAALGTDQNQLEGGQGGPSPADMTQTLESVGEGQFDALIGDGAMTGTEEEQDGGIVDGDIDMHNSAAGLLDQYYTSNPSTPGGNMNNNNVAAPQANQSSLAPPPPPQPQPKVENTVNTSSTALLGDTTAQSVDTASDIKSPEKASETAGPSTGAQS